MAPLFPVPWSAGTRLPSALTLQVPVMSLPSSQFQDSRPNIKDSSGKGRTRRRGKQVQALEWGILLGLGFPQELEPWEVPNLWCCGHHLGLSGLEEVAAAPQSIPRAITEVPLALFGSSHHELLLALAVGAVLRSSSTFCHPRGDILGYLGVEGTFRGTWGLIICCWGKNPSHHSRLI